MSESGDGDEINRREVAYRLFAAEFDDADYSYAESDEERAPNYVVTPTGARVNRVFVVGVLTEVEQVNEDVLRARIVDPTGAFVVYAGQYQPEALAALEAVETPSFVAVTGKARTFEPDDADVVYTSIRPESVSEVDAATRDRWVVTAAEQTVDRVGTMAAAHERVERDDTLREVLEAADIERGLAAGIPLALDHYETTPAYLAAVRDLALDAARVVAGDVESVDELGLAPNAGGDHPVPFAAELDADEIASGTADDEAGTERESVSEDATETDTDVEAAPGEGESGDESIEGDADPTPGPAAETPSPSEVAGEAAPDAGTDGEEDAASASDADAASGGDGEMYELSEEEREEVEENYDVGFSSGDEIPDAGGADIDAETPAGEATEDETVEDKTVEDKTVEDDTTEDDDIGDFDDGGDDQDEDSEDEADDLDDFTESEYDEAESDAEDADAGSMDLDLEDYVVDLMSELDDGDGAPRDEVIGAATDERDVDEGDVEDAIQDALMNGRCYEAGDDHLKAI